LKLAIEKKAASANAFLVGLDGEIDLYSAAQLKPELAALVEQDIKYIVINLEKVTYLDSTGLGILLGILKKLRERGGDLLIVAPSSRIVRVFEITGLVKIFNIYASEAEALDKEGLKQ